MIQALKMAKFTNAFNVLALLNSVVDKSTRVHTTGTSATSVQMSLRLFSQ